MWVAVFDFQRLDCSVVRVTSFIDSGLLGPNQRCRLVVEATSPDGALYLNVAPAISEEFSVSTSRHTLIVYPPQRYREEGTVFCGHYITLRHMVVVRPHAGGRQAWQQFFDLMLPYEVMMASSEYLTNSDLLCC
jgi:hypothetical protein